MVAARLNWPCIRVNLDSHISRIDLIVDGVGTPWFLEANVLPGQAEAVVYDAPVLQYRASHSGKGKARVVGEIFRPEPYGIAVPTGSPRREQIDGVLLEMTADGTLTALKNKYFGAN